VVSITNRQTYKETDRQTVDECHQQTDVQTLQWHHLTLLMPQCLANRHMQTAEYVAERDEQ